MTHFTKRYYLITLITCMAFLRVSGKADGDTIKVLAILTSQYEGDKIHIAKYKVVKELQGRVSNKNIRVGCYFYKKDPEEPDTAVLTLIKYGGSTEMPDYYIFSGLRCCNRN